MAPLEVWENISEHSIYPFSSSRERVRVLHGYASVCRNLDYVVHNSSVWADRHPRPLLDVYLVSHSYPILKSSICDRPSSTAEADEEQVEPGKSLRLTKLRSVKLDHLPPRVAAALMCCIESP
ncbi:hypothetical protein FRC03_006913, partial [Tulasnella sp. 419]